MSELVVSIDERGYVVAVDPGREKCGIAVVSFDRTVKEQHVVSRSQAIQSIEKLWLKYNPAVLVLGDGTGSKEFQNEIAAASIGGAASLAALVDEHLSTLEARERYFKANPPRGWRRLIPRSLQTPPEPIDDYVAVILAERYLDGFPQSIGKRR